MIKFKQILKEENLREFEILTGKYKGKIISWWKNQYQHIDLMPNRDCFCGECLYCSRKHKNLKNKDILQIADAILNYKQRLEEE